ncbi:hypothetical protein [Sorangium sp. So ce388]|uniref:hypothetical protein n=1 Tax=Sorangium sp. So ce388 TaxID=3133309 RepID=UPI003F5AE597
MTIYGRDDEQDRVESCCYGCLDARGSQDGHIACRWSPEVQRAHDEGRLRDNRLDHSAWTAE